MACPLSYTKDGFETQIGINHFGHFALTLGLLPALKEGAKLSGRNSRVVNLSSLAHIISDVNFDDINFKNRPYNNYVSYGQSKTANILFSVALTSKFQSEGIVSNAVMPGAIMTNLGKFQCPKSFEQRFSDDSIYIVLKSNLV
jgi:NAD(P)-dependent dehydrogenase (short-subunit alcohol dehydrogenase family)